MEENGIGNELNNYFTTTVNSLKVLEQKFSQEERVKNPSIYDRKMEAKVFVITENKDLTSLTYED